MAMLLSKEQLMEYIRPIPKDGRVQQDISPLLADAQAYISSIDLISAQFQKRGIGAVTAVEGPGYVYGAPLAHHLGVAFAPIREAGKLPWLTNQVTVEGPGGARTLEMHQDSLLMGQRVLVVGDLLGTGDTLLAAAKLVEQAGAFVLSVAVMLEVTELKGREKLADYKVFSLLTV